MTERTKYILNWGPLPACPTPKPGPSSARWLGDGGHRWGPNQGRMCLAIHDCLDCAARIEVDSSD